MPLLEARNLSIAFPGTREPLYAVSGVDFTIERCERVALVGESGSGKTLSGMSCLGLAPANAILGGSVRLDGVELIGANRASLFINLIPLFGALGAVLILGEQLQPFHMIAGALVIAGIVLAEWSARRT